MVDVYKHHNVTISKRDSDGHKIASAHLRVTGRETGASADITPVEWVSVEGQDKMLSLSPSNYTLHETETPTGFASAEDIPFIVLVNGTLTVNGHIENAVVMTDMPQSGSLSVKKTVTSNMGSRDKEFSFTVTLKNADNTPYIGSIAYTKGEETGTLTADASSSATFTLSHGDPITFTRLSHGLKYTVAEQDYRSDGYTTTIHNNEGTIQAENTTVTFVNNKDAEIATGINVIFETGILMTILGVAMYLFFRMRFKNNR